MAIYIPPAMKGVESLPVVENVAEKYGSAGIIVGGLAIRLWQATMQRNSIGKDVDVLIVDEAKRNFPVQWERGVDWWVSSDRTHRPSNGTHVGLLWKLVPREGVQLTTGIYLLSPDLLRQCCDWELANGLKIGEERQELIKRMGDQPIIDIPVLDGRSLVLVKLDQTQTIEVHPKKSGL